jgi:hypothetical protein
MTFHEYVSLIAQSVAETGYDQFHPSACVSNSTDEKLHVLDGELTEEGEEAVALSWTESISKTSDTIFLAFRGGKRTVAVIELKGGKVMDRKTIRVTPHEEDSE